MANKETEALKAQNAALESKIDMLETELSYLHDILTQCGFPEGIQSLKASVEEVLADQESYPFVKKQG